MRLHSRGRKAFVITEEQQQGKARGDFCSSAPENLLKKLLSKSLLSSSLSQRNTKSAQLISWAEFCLCAAVKSYGKFCLK